MAVLLLSVLLQTRIWAFQIRLRPQLEEGVPPQGICFKAEREAEDGSPADETQAIRIRTDETGEGTGEAAEAGWYRITMDSPAYVMEPFRLKIPDEEGNDQVLACPKLLSGDESVENTSSGNAGGSALGSTGSFQTPLPVQTLDPTLLGNAWLLAGVSGGTVLILWAFRR